MDATIYLNSGDIISVSNLVIADNIKPIHILISDYLKLNDLKLNQDIEYNVVIFENNIKIIDLFLNTDYHLHSNKTPAYIYRYPNGTIKYSYWYNNGVKHCPIGQSNCAYYPTGSLQIKSVYNNGAIHNINGPAIIHWNIHKEIEYELFYLHNDKINVISTEDLKLFIYKNKEKYHHEYIDLLKKESTNMFD